MLTFSEVFSRKNRRDNEARECAHEDPKDESEEEARHELFESPYGQPQPAHVCSWLADVARRAHAMSSWVTWLVFT